ARRVSFRSSTRQDPSVNRIVPPGVGDGSDPTLSGGTVTVYNNAGSGEAVTVSLPASGWSFLGGRGYRFRDSSAPISRVTVTADRISLAGGGAGWGYTLDEPSQGRIAVRLTLGGGRPWCAEAPAKVTATRRRRRAATGWAGSSRSRGRRRRPGGRRY